MIAFSGHAEITQWVEGWNQRGSRVLGWEIATFIFENNVAAVEWTFECEDRRVRYFIDGASVFGFDDERICRINEYRWTERLFSGLDRK